jgi:phosphoribosylformylglycinamidine synthase subunit PurS
VHEFTSQIPYFCTVKYQAEIEIMPRKGLLDPQGKAVSLSMKNIGLNAISNARIGKFVTLEIEANTADEAKAMADEASTKLLANLIMESYEITIKEL